MLRGPVVVLGMSTEPRGRIPLGEEAAAAAIGVAGVLCFMEGIRYLREGDIVGSRFVLIAAWLLASIGFFLSPSIRKKWGRGTLSIAATVLLGCVLLCVYVYHLRVNTRAMVATGPPVEHRVAAESRAHTPEPPPVAETPSSAELKPVTAVEAPPVVSEPAQPEPEVLLREEQQPTAPAEAPVVAAGPTITQKTTGDYSPAIVADGPVTYNPPEDPNKPVVYYFPNGQTRTKIGSNIIMGDGPRMAFDTILSLNKAKKWGELAELCEEEIKAVPDWLTPYVFAGVAYVGLDNLGNARRRLEQFSKRANANPDYANWHSRCIQILEQLDEAQTEGAGATGP